jgi:uncharacterized protein VirK/YbjX
MDHISAACFNTKKSVNYWGKVLSIIKDTEGWGGSLSKIHLVYWRRFIFIVWAIFRRNEMEALLNFFAKDQVRLSIASSKPSILEQTTREWLYFKSTARERIALTKDHFLFSQTRLSKAALQMIYIADGITLWSEQYKENTLSLKLHYDRFYRKEGLMAVSLNLGANRLYSVSFWFAKDSNNKMRLWVGSLQGSRGQSQLIHDLTKHFFGYRPKNLMVTAIRAIADLLQVERIYAVSNYGSYVNHRMRMNRRLKTSLDDFWQEVGGYSSSDARFFELPIFEARKTIQEVASQKRNLYRKRYAALDAIISEITERLKPYLLTNSNRLVSFNARNHKDYAS